MEPAFTILASLACVVTTIGLCVAAGVDGPSTRAMAWWSGLPYLGFCTLAFVHRGSREAARRVLVATAVVGGLATFLYARDLWPFIEAGPDRDQIMDCGGPLVEFGVPVVQWLFIGVFALSLRSRRWPGPRDTVFEPWEE